MLTLSPIRQEIAQHRSRLARVRWLGVGTGALVAASTWWSPAVFPSIALSGWARAVVALATGLLGVAVVLVARASESRLDAFRIAMSDLSAHASELQARAAADPGARAEYLDFLRDMRDELQRVRRRWLSRGVTTEQFALAVQRLDENIAAHEKVLSVRAV